MAAIRAVAGGATVFQPAVTERLLRVADRVHVETAAPIERLTARELEVVRGASSPRPASRPAGRALGPALQALELFPEVCDQPWLAQRLGREQLDRKQTIQRYDC
jgi:hypothetical protein